MKAVLVTGATGQVGQELQRCAWPDGWTAVAVDRAQLDLTDMTSIEAMIDTGHLGVRWAAVINAAAYTAVDNAESDSVAAWTINALAPAAMGAGCARAGIPLVHISTDYVFDGNRDGAWTVKDPVAPLGVYGASKLGGELAVRCSGARHAIVRTSWVVSSHGHNFVKTMLRLAGDRDTLRVVGDQWGSPTSAADLAHALMTIVLQLCDDPDRASGIYHFSNSGCTSWANFAAEIFHQSAMRGGPSAQVEAITTDQYPTIARRPRNSLLDHDAIRKEYGIHPRRWEEALGDICNELIGVPK